MLFSSPQRYIILFHSATIYRNFSLIIFPTLASHNRSLVNFYKKSLGLLKKIDLLCLRFKSNQFSIHDTFLYTTNMKITKILSALTIGVILAFQASAETWNLDGSDYEMTLTASRTLAEGVTHKTIKLSGASQLEVQLIEVDMTSDKVDLLTNKSRNIDPDLKIKVSEDRLYKKNLSDQRKEVIEAGQQPIVGINGDFFTNYGMLGNQFSNGTIIRCDKTSYPVWYMTADRRFGMGDFPLKATARATYSACDGTVAEYPVGSINNYRDENYLTIFTPAPGRTTGTNKYGYELYAELIEGEVGIKGKCKFRIVDDPDSHVRCNSSLDEYYVLSGHGYGGLFLTAKWNGANKILNDKSTGRPYPHLVAGDIVEVTFSTEIPDANIKEMIGGNPVILLNNEVQNTQDALDHLVNREPRTCIAYTNDNSKFFLAVVDGRRKGEAEGCTSRQLACIMKNAGAENAFNLDGGGSACMLDALTDKVLNKPTDGFAQGIYDLQRATQNSLWVVAKRGTSAIDDVAVDLNDENAPVEYYNLQGVRVYNPAAGLYIRRQGNNVAKTILR